jgi:hypothetical protein
VTQIAFEGRKDSPHLLDPRVQRLQFL